MIEHVLKMLDIPSLSFVNGSNFAVFSIIVITSIQYKKDTAFMDLLEIRKQILSDKESFPGGLRRFRGE